MVKKCKNGIGGALFFGIINDEVLVGLDDAKSVSEKISEAIKTKMGSIPQVVLEIHAENEKEFVILKVPSGQEAPYYYTGDGNRIAFVRIGNRLLKSKSGSVLYGSRQQNQGHGGAVRHFRCTDTVSDESDLWWNIGIQLFM